MNQKISVLNAFSEDIKSIAPFFHADEKNIDIFKDIFKDSFSEAEFSFAPKDRKLEITIDGKGTLFHNKIPSIMKRFGYEKEIIESYSRINDFFPDTGTFLKIDFESGEPSSLSIYYQAPVTIKLAKKISTIVNIPVFPGKTITSLSRQLGIKEIFLGLDLGNDKIPGLSVFYMIPPMEAKERLCKIMPEIFRTLCFNETCINFFNKYNPLLIEFICGDLLISFQISAKKPNMIKIDYDMVAVPSAYKVLKDYGLDSDEMRKVVRIAQALETTVLNYFGIKFFDNGELSFKFYFKRSYNTSEDADLIKFADFLESSIWRFQ